MYSAGNTDYLDPAGELTIMAKSSFLVVGLCDVEESLISHIEVIRLKHDDYFIKYNKIRYIFQIYCV